MPVVTEWDIWVRSTDMDADGVVNNARYFEYMEQARLEHLVMLGIVQRPRPDGSFDRSFTLAETTCRYRAPMRHREWVRVQCWTEKIGNSSFVLSYAIIARDTGTLVAEGTSAQVWLDAEGKAAALPEDIRQALEGSLE